MMLLQVGLISDQFDPGSLVKKSLKGIRSFARMKHGQNENKWMVPVKRRLN
jgi:hypothetical protein